jgi:hypothetical protein
VLRDIAGAQPRLRAIGRVGFDPAAARTREGA